MKLSSLEQISEVINDKRLINLLISKSDHEIDEFVAKLNSMFNRTNQEKTKLISKYIETNGNHYVYLMITDKAILETRTFKEQMALINKYIKVGDGVYVRDDDDATQYTIVHKHYGIYDIIADNNILETRTFKEQMTLIDKCIKSNSYEVYLMIINEATRTFKEQITLIDKYIESGNDYNVYSMTNPLNFKSEEEPFDLTVKKIDDYLARKNLSQTINELKDLKAIVNFLKENNIDEFNEDTKVYTYNNSNK